MYHHRSAVGQHLIINAIVVSSIPTRGMIVFTLFSFLHPVQSAASSTFKFTLPLNWTACGKQNNMILDSLFVFYELFIYTVFLV